MKIKRRTKNDRTAFFFMNPIEYFKYRRSINLERRLDKTLPAETKQKRDRSRAAFLAREFKEGTPVRLSDVLGKPCDLEPEGGKDVSGCDV